MEEKEENTTKATFKGYMESKAAKLREKWEEEVQQVSTIFNGVTIWINGKTDPSPLELVSGRKWIELLSQKRMMAQHGGRSEHYQSLKRVTHIVAENVPFSKARQLRNQVIVHPKWITDSIEQGKRLPENKYRHYFRPEAGVSSAQQTKFADFFEEKKDERGGIHTDDPDFLEKYYAASRMHHLSTWKMEMRELAAAMSRRAHFPPAQPKQQTTNKEEEALEMMGKEEGQTTNDQRIILHVDMDAFFVTVSLRDRPDLSFSVPVAVCGSKGIARGAQSHADVASANYAARKKGVHNGMFLAKAREVCPELVILPYEFRKYEAVSHELYRVFFKHVRIVQGVSVDEALLDGTGLGDPLQLADTLRAEIFAKTGCHASKVVLCVCSLVGVGIGPNPLLARVATREAKPNGVFRLHGGGAALIHLAPLLLRQLPGCGHAIETLLSEHGISTVGEARIAGVQRLQEILGPQRGRVLYDRSSGVDPTPLATHYQRNSVSTMVNYGIRFDTMEQALSLLDRIAAESCRRARAAQVRVRGISLQLLQRAKGAAKEAAKFLGHGWVDTNSRSITLQQATDVDHVVQKHVRALFAATHIPVEELRGVGVQLTKLVSTLEQPAIVGPLEKHLKLPQPKMLPSSPSEIDPEVLAALPEHMQKEVQEDYRVKRMREEEEERTKDEQISVLPSPSRIDPSVLANLPPDIRAELEESYRRQDHPIEKRRAVVHLPSRRLALGKSKRKGIQRHLSELERERKHRSRELEVRARHVAQVAGLDPSVMLNLPPYMLREVVEEYYHRHPEQAPSKRVKRSKNPPPLSSSAELQIALERHAPPSVTAMFDWKGQQLPHLREALARLSVHEPRSGLCELLMQLIRQMMVRDTQLTQAMMLLRFLRRLWGSKQWHGAFNKVLREVQDTWGSIHHGHLDIEFL